MYSMNKLLILCCPNERVLEGVGPLSMEVAMTVIKQDDFISSVADALQYISYYHPVDYITNLARAYELEESVAAKDAMAQILINSRMCAEGHRPICQDTGIVTIFLKVGMGVQFADATMDLQAMCDAGVRRAYLDPDNMLRASVLADPAFTRKNTKDNTPAVVVTELVAGDGVDVIVAAKGGGSEAKSKFAMLNPSDSIVDWVLKMVPQSGRWMVPAGHARHWHWRYGGKGDAAGEEGPDGPDRHAGPDCAWAPPRSLRKHGLNCTARSTRWALERRGWVGLPPCWTSRSLTLPRMRRTCRSP